MEQEQEPLASARPFILANSKSKTRRSHRLGWSKWLDGSHGEEVIIDSSAREAYVPSSLPSYASEVSFPDERSCRISYSGTKKPEVHVAIDGESIEETEREAMRICLKQFLGNKKGVVAAYLRTVDGQLAGFYGLMAFDFSRRLLTMEIVDPNSLSDIRQTWTSQLVIEWDGKGSARTAQDVQVLIGLFLVDHTAQFADVFPIFNEFVAACTKQWGHPRRKDMEHPVDAIS